MMSMILLRSLLRRMESIIGYHTANRPDSTTGAIIELAIRAVNGSDALDEGHMVNMLRL